MDLNQLYWLIQLGRPKHKGTIYDIRNDVSDYVKKPVFFLSTGRCGTKWFSELLRKDRSLAVFHQPVPSLAIQGRKIHELLARGDGQLSEMEADMITEIFWAAREEHIRYSYKTEKRYVETNNYITFFAPVLKKIFPDAKFVHLIRHPGEFVRSGISRNYYSGNAADIFRLRPQDEENRQAWKNMGQSSKVAWLWNETNLRIEEMMTHASDQQFKRFNINDMSVEKVKELLFFLEITLPEDYIRKQLPKKKNKQTHTLDPFSTWDGAEKQKVTDITSNLAAKYGFSFRNN